MIEVARAAARFALPSDCLACGKLPVDGFFRGGVCASCWSAVPALASGRCARCDEDLPGSGVPALCGRCLLDPPPFRTLRAAAPYRGAGRDVLLAFKFRGADYLATRLAAVMLERLPRPAAAEIVCVPGTSRSRRARGYHPPELLAAEISRRLGIPFVRGGLVKARDTDVQSRLPLSRRARNVRGAYRAAGRPAANVLLVDDVATSGATARECARRLTEAGAGSVGVWCFARASRADTPEAA